MSNTTISQDPASSTLPPPDATVPTTGSNLPPGLWLPLLSLAFVCLLFVCFRRAGASGFLFGEEGGIGKRWIALKDWTKGERRILLSDSSNTLHPLSDSQRPSSPTPSQPFPRPSHYAASDVSEDEDDDREDILPPARDGAAGADQETGKVRNGIMRMFGGKKADGDWQRRIQV